MKPLKFNPEIALSFTAVDRFIFRVADLKELEEVTDELKSRLSACHIYLIGKRPRLSIKPESIRATEEDIFFTLEYRSMGTVTSVDASLPRKIFMEMETRFEVSPYPHREILTYDQDGNQIATTLIANHAQLFNNLPEEVRNLEIIYIGKGLRNSAKDRLENHSTLQKILADVNSNEPDSEVFALVYSFEKYKKPGFQLFDQDVMVETTGVQAEARLRKALAYRPTIETQVALIEASLISYFATDKYNTHYLDFPHKGGKLLEEIYEADFAAVIVTIDNENIAYQKIFSERVPPNYVHRSIIDFRRIEGKFPFIPENTP